MIAPEDCEGYVYVDPQLDTDMIIADLRDMCLSLGFALAKTGAPCPYCGGRDNKHEPACKYAVTMWGSGEESQ